MTVALVLTVSLHADERFDRVADVVAAKMKEYAIPGVALGVSIDGVRTTRDFGITSVENPLPVTDDTLFQIGSITKTFTATALVRLAEEGKVRLDAPVRDYLPGWRVKDDEATRRATVRTLLTHMGDWEGDLFDDTGNGDDALGRLVARMSTLEQIAPFGRFWSYNNAAFYAAGRIVEVVTGKPYETAVHDLVIAPAGLKRTFFFPSDVMTYRFAVGHAGPIVIRPWPIPRGMNPAGGLSATIPDLLTWGEYRLHATFDPIGWQTYTVGDVHVLWHDGFAVGQDALLLVIPSRHLTVALLTNSVRGEELAHDLRQAIARAYLGLDDTDPPPIPMSNLAQYAGRYARPFMDIVVTVDGERLRIQRIQKQGFPTAKSFIPPAAPPAPYAFYAKDGCISLDSLHDRVEFLRRPDGAIGWIRVGGRIAARTPSTHYLVTDGTVSMFNSCCN